ncbi:RNA-binding S4 domain-containing protein [uncultured Oscillibacter sp.]|nr:RNA-binding S4 domain-containing protein [uncultured Oscillibacter sp.]
MNGEPCAMRGKKLRPGDRVEVDGDMYEVAGGETQHPVKTEPSKV